MASKLVRGSSKRWSAPNGSQQRKWGSNSAYTYAVVVFLLTYTIPAAHYSMNWFLTGHNEGAPPRLASGLCAENGRIEGSISQFISTKQTFTSISWLSSDTALITPEDPQSVQFVGPDVLLDESDLVSCFAFSGGRGGATIVSNSSQYRIAHFTLDNSLVNGLVDSIYYPRDGSLWGLFEGEVPAGLEDVVTSRVSPKAVYVLLGSFCFAPEAGSSQTYAIDPYIASRNEFLFSVFYFRISSNWGGPHTCVSRLRFHELD